MEIDQRAVAEAGAALSNRWWRITNLYRIVDEDNRLVKFKPNRAQLDFDSKKHTKNIIGKSRRHGFTTWETIDCLDQCIFGKNESIMISAHIKNVAEEIFQVKVTRAWEALPPAIKQLVKLNAKTASSIEIDNGMGINRLSVGVLGIGSTLSRAHVTELSYTDVHEPDKASNMIRGIMAATRNGRIDIESTGRADSGFFYDYFMSAKDDMPTSPSEFRRFFYNWQWDDRALNRITDEYIKEITSGQGAQWDRFHEYQKLHNLTDREIAAYYSFWIEYNKDWDLLHSEYPTTIDEMFSSGQDRLFSGDALDEQEIIEPNKVGKWRFFHEPEDGHKYCVGVDVAEGIGKDASTICVLDVTDSKVAATYVNERIAPDSLSVEILTACKKYNEALASVERNNHGHTTLSRLRDVYDAKRIYKQIRKEKVRTQRTFKFGWETNGATKPKMFYDLSTAVNNGEIGLSDENLIMEARMYTKDAVRLIKPKEGQTSHFDLLTAATIAWQTRVDALALDHKVIPVDTNLTKKLKELQAKQFMY